MMMAVSETGLGGHFSRGALLSSITLVQKIVGLTPTTNRAVFIEI